MSDEKRREELKATINEQLDKLSLEDLERVAGGGAENNTWTCKWCGETLSGAFLKWRIKDHLLSHEHVYSKGDPSEL